MARAIVLHPKDNVATLFEGGTRSSWRRAMVALFRKDGPLMRAASRRSTLSRGHNW